ASSVADGGRGEMGGAGRPPVPLEMVPMLSDPMSPGPPSEDLAGCVEDLVLVPNVSGPGAMDSEPRALDGDGPRTATDLGHGGAGPPGEGQGSGRVAQEQPEGETGVASVVSAGKLQEGKSDGYEESLGEVALGGLDGKGEGMLRTVKQGEGEEERGQGMWHW
ncbi:unnamed protein product, partial [Discosporangium mesarthrocarpum]